MNICALSVLNLLLIHEFQETEKSKNFQFLYSNVFPLDLFVFLIIIIIFFLFLAILLKKNTSIYSRQCLNSTQR